MEDQRAVRSTLVRGVSIEFVVEDGTDRSVGERTDLDGTRGGGFQPYDTERPRQPQDAEAGSEALFGVRPVLQDKIAERDGCRPDEGGVPADTADSPVGVTAMTGRHMVGSGRVLAIAARSQRAPDRAVAGTIDNAEFYDLVLQQPQGPACASLGRLGTGQGNQLGLLLAVKNPSNGRHRARLAAQHGLEAFFHQLFAHPVNHGWAGFQSFDDPVVALPFPNQGFKPFAFLAAQPHNILLYRNLLRSHDCLPRQSLATKANH